METRAHHILIGLFTVIAVAGAMVFTLWLDKSSGDRSYAYYEVGFDRAVSGLAVGNEVLYSGIKVGDVVDLRLHPDDPRHVRARIRVFSDIPIRKDTRASLHLANITGSMSIQLHGGTLESPLLVGDSENPPLIVADPSPLSMLLADSETLARNLNRLLANAMRLLSEENIGRFGSILANLEQTTGTLADQRQKIVDALVTFNEVGTETSALLQELNLLSKNANSLVIREGRQTLDSTSEAIGALRDAAARLDGILAENQTSLSQGMRGLTEFGPAMRDLRSILGNLSRITRRLEDNPAAFFFGPDPIQEFTP
ncbi:MAG: MlaD family protein [Desulfobacterales bacterium]|jgi:phospholipid/cholesterol/gamma-HCH transport system substrate-binding protein|nr:MlaD family protein [Desulfobacteraceae bacterium]MDD3992311.1 MlaD family protein [Desulfobacteraceae bacterium]MDY0313146.1 MlaD family protein [Desulfobacterales bacterium]